jgi:CobQ-like glutamine amidotransferase family enzyme
MSETIHILQLYPRDMNIYGDFGNAQVLSRRLAWHGYTPVLHSYNPGDDLPEQVDLAIGGGGQDSGQGRIHEDLLNIAPKLRELVEADTPMLMICGLYQLFGQYFQTRAGQRIEGIGVLDISTEGTDTRLIGNVVARSDEFGEIVGYENHSGQTYLGPGVKPLATVTTGEGNNAQDDTEGARYRNVVGSYLHGALLPKNPAIADFLISAAVRRRYGTDIMTEVTTDAGELSITQLEEQARRVAVGRPR